VTANDRPRMLEILFDSARRLEVAVHSYVLMDDHFHLLVTPPNANGVSRLMQAVGRSYVRYFNDLHHRSGTLWDGRYRSTLIQADLYLLACMAYVDLNPVRAGLVSRAQDFPWSSHAHYIGQTNDKLITPHSLYWALGNTPFAREAAYAQCVQAGIDPVQSGVITEAALKGWALGDTEFVSELHKKTNRRAVKGNAGRPALARLN
jgi:putative transposase